MLLLPRSARPAPPDALARALLRRGPAGLPRCASGASCASSAPSIFSRRRFNGYVATRFLPDANLHGHRPAVPICAPLSWGLCSCVGHLSPRQVHPSLQTMLTTVRPLAAPRRARPHTPGAPAHSEFVDDVPILSPAPPCRAAAVLRDISAGTSYQTVRLVFRPYAHLPPSS